ncbi:MAG: hypothetical protein KAR35_04145 [Candidatus Heimdallarchaeota archaeon]|nr:hypothetical protein [Candidatus Heimdallarchaeota archaeon]MCK5048546.1 hypothetical protein [Candidatus Heimdallarchaeota archaeon]
MFKPKELSSEYKEKILKYFPHAIRGDIVTREVNNILQKQNFTHENTLFGTSCCPDEINDFVTNFRTTWGNIFPLAGLGGIPFTGVTGFNAFSSHKPDNGNLFILFASHIGIDELGKLGNIIRRGMTKKTPTCGSAITAYNQFMDKEFRTSINQRDDEWDEQQKYMETIIEQSLPMITASPEPLLTLTEVVYDVIYKKILKIIPKDFDGNIALLGGIQINTSKDFFDYFLFKEFKIINPKNKEEINLQNDLQRAFNRRI